MFDGAIFIEELLNKKTDFDTWKKECKKGIVFQVGKDIGTDKYNVIKKKFLLEREEMLMKELKKRYPNQNIIIINKELIEKEIK